MCRTRKLMDASVRFTSLLVLFSRISFVTCYFTLLLNRGWTSVSDINNKGRIVGLAITENGAVRKGFTYDCESLFKPFDIEGAGWVLPAKVDDDGTLYGTVQGPFDEGYFIARPSSLMSELMCSLMPRDDVADPPISFSVEHKFELSGDMVMGVKIGDMNNDGVNDLLIYHEMGKTIVYYGPDFDSKIKYSGTEYDTLQPVNGFVDQTQLDFNNDGLVDKVEVFGYQGNRMYLAKPGGSYFYVPQSLPEGNIEFGDMNGDGLIDVVLFHGGFGKVIYQDAPAIANPDGGTGDIPADNGTSGTPVDNGTSGTPADNGTSGAPAIDADAGEVESTDRIQEVLTSDSVRLESGDIMWFESATVIKLNEASNFAAGQLIDYKAWQNPDGTLIGIKVEVVDEGRRLLNLRRRE
jgi:hypothetical protein